MLPSESFTDGVRLPRRCSRAPVPRIGHSYKPGPILGEPRAGRLSPSPPCSQCLLLGCIPMSVAVCCPQVSSRAGLALTPTGLGSTFVQEPRRHLGDLPGEEVPVRCSSGAQPSPCTGCPSTPTVLTDLGVAHPEALGHLHPGGQARAHSHGTVLVPVWGQWHRGWPQHGGRAPSEKQSSGGRLLATSPCRGTACGILGQSWTPQCGTLQDTAGPTQGDLIGRWGPEPPQWGPSWPDRTPSSRHLQASMAKLQRTTHHTPLQVGSSTGSPPGAVNSGRVPSISSSALISRKSSQGWASGQTPGGLFRVRPGQPPGYAGPHPAQTTRPAGEGSPVSSLPGT